MIDESDIERVVDAGKSLPPAAASYLEEDFVMNLLETVLDYMLNTTVVVRALDYFRANCGATVRTLDQLEELMARFTDDQEGNVRLAFHLWGYKHWTRAEQLRRLCTYFRSIGVVDQPSLKAWAHGSHFRRDFEGRVKGLGPAVYQWLVMRQGVDTVKPDIHVRRFAETAVGRPLSDAETIDVVTRAAHHLKVKAYEFDWRIWEASRGGALPYPRATPQPRGSKFSCLNEFLAGPLGVGIGGPRRPWSMFEDAAKEFERFLAASSR